MKPSANVGPGTDLENSALGHKPEKRELYYARIRNLLQKDGKGCTIPTLTPARFADAKIKYVSDVIDLVAKDLT